MKKWLVGCLIVGLLLLVVGGGAAYWFVWRPLSAAGGDFMGQVDELKKIGEAEQAVKNQSPFTAPADSKLSIAQVNAFVTVQQTIFDKMGPDVAVLEEKYKKMGENGTPENADLKDVMGAYADITRLMSKAKQAQVAGLNVQNMSLEEYRWIREQVSAALPYLTMDKPAPEQVDAPTDQSAAEAAANDAVAKAQEAAANAIKESIPGGQQIGDVMKGPESEAARANIELLRPHKELLYKTMTAAWLSM
jgi:hypothetical protein